LNELVRISYAKVRRFCDIGYQVIDSIVIYKH